MRLNSVQNITAVNLINPIRKKRDYNDMLFLMNVSDELFEQQDEIEEICGFNKRGKFSSDQ